MSAPIRFWPIARIFSAIERRVRDWAATCSGSGDRLDDRQFSHCSALSSACIGATSGTGPPAFPQPPDRAARRVGGSVVPPAEMVPCAPDIRVDRRARSGGGAAHLAAQSRRARHRGQRACRQNHRVPAGLVSGCSRCGRGARGGGSGRQRDDPGGVLRRDGAGRARRHRPRERTARERGAGLPERAAGLGSRAGSAPDRCCRQRRRPAAVLSDRRGAAHRGRRAHRAARSPVDGREDRPHPRYEADLRTGHARRRLRIPQRCALGAAGRVVGGGVPRGRAGPGHRHGAADQRAIAAPLRGADHRGDRVQRGPGRVPAPAQRGRGPASWPRCWRRWSSCCPALC